MTDLAAGHSWRRELRGNGERMLTFGLAGAGGASRRLQSERRQRQTSAARSRHASGGTALGLPGPATRPGHCVAQECRAASTQGLRRRISGDPRAGCEGWGGYVELNGVAGHFHRPHPRKEVRRRAVESVRRFLNEAGIERN